VANAQFVRFVGGGGGGAGNRFSPNINIDSDGASNPYISFRTQGGVEGARLQVYPSIPQLLVLQMPGETIRWQQDLATGDVTAGNILLPRLGPQRLDGSTAVAAGVVTDVTIQASAAANVWYLPAVRTTSTTGAFGPGAVVNGAEAVQAQPSWHMIRPGAGANDLLRLVNGTAGSETFNYRVYQVDET
jgi:hypothetical protein